PVPTTASQTPSPIQTPLEKPPYTLGQAQLSWGKTQIQQMLKDRSEMAKYVTEGDDLWNWTVRQFGGEYMKGGIRWDSKEPAPELWDAFYYGPLNGQKAYIQVTKRLAWKEYRFNEPKTGPVLWYETAFELLNLKTIAPVYQLNEIAKKREVSRKDYILERMLIEWNTEKEVRDFYYNLWVPQCHKLSLSYEDKDLKKIFGTVIDGAGRTKEDVLRYDFVSGTFHYEYWGKCYDDETGVSLSTHIKDGDEIPPPP
ncbi:MAG TPA: hypothetical protein VIJ93_00120, partial [bacterium]